MKLYLGIDGGQSHTTALIADESGRILGQGQAGPSNHTREPGGRERLIGAVTGSIGEAVARAGLGGRQPAFISAHLALTGEPEEKIEIVREIVTADHLVVGHDAPGALAGAFAGGDGIVVLAGTGSVACGQTTAPNGERTFVRVGGHGYLFSDEGSAFSIAREALARALRNEDAGCQGDLRPILLEYFERPNLKAIAQDCYAGVITRDRLASFAATLAEAAESDDAEAIDILNSAALDLARLASLAAHRLGVETKPMMVSYGGGVFRSHQLMVAFAANVTEFLLNGRVEAPRFGPAVGALLLAYRQSGFTLNQSLLSNIERTETES